MNPADQSTNLQQDQLNKTEEKSKCTTLLMLLFLPEPILLVSFMQPLLLKLPRLDPFIVNGFGTKLSSSKSTLTNLFAEPVRNSDLIKSIKLKKKKKTENER